MAESGARVLTHRRNQYWLTDFPNEWVRRHDFYAAVFEESGLSPELREAVRAATDVTARFAESVPVARLLDEGDVLTLDGAPWQVLFLPGHAGGLICLYQPERRLLLSSDHLLKHITSNPLLEPPARGETVRRRSLVDYLASLRRVADLDVVLALPAHGEPISDHRGLIQERFGFHRERQERILALLGNGGRTAYEIAAGPLAGPVAPEHLPGSVRGHRPHGRAGGRGPHCPGSQERAAALRAGMIRSHLGRRLFWPAAVAIIEAVYILAFVRPYGLLDHYATPGMDLGKLGGYSVEAGWGFLAAMGLLFAVYALAYRRSGSHGAAPLGWIVRRRPALRGHRGRRLPHRRRGRLRQYLLRAHGGPCTGRTRCSRRPTPSERPALSPRGLVLVAHPLRPRLGRRRRPAQPAHRRRPAGRSAGLQGAECRRCMPPVWGSLRHCCGVMRPGYLAAGLCSSPGTRW